MRGLTDTLFFRTSVEPAAPAAVDLERDELSFYPLLYWPVTRDQPLPSSEAYGRLNTYLRAGGMILFDTRDADLTSSGATSPAARRLQQIALPLDIPPLEVVPQDHVLTRAFYLLQNFPGRHARGPVWVEAAPPDAEQAEGIPFRNLNDGVTPVVIGGNDWAAAWAVDGNGRPMLPVGRGYAGERQARAGLPFWRQPRDACADRQLQIRPSACAGPAGPAGAIGADAMTQTILFDPLVPWPVIWAAGAVTLAALILGAWKGLSGWGPARAGRTGAAGGPCPARCIRPRTARR